MTRGFSKLFVKPRAEERKLKRSLVDRRRQLQHLTFTENGYYERVSGFESGDAVVNSFVVFVAREIAKKLSGTRIDYRYVVDA